MHLHINVPLLFNVEHIDHSTHSVFLVNDNMNDAMLKCSEKPVMIRECTEVQVNHFKAVHTV